MGIKSYSILSREARTFLDDPNKNTGKKHEPSVWDTLIPQTYPTSEGLAQFCLAVADKYESDQGTFDDKSHPTRLDEIIHKFHTKKCLGQDEVDILKEYVTNKFNSVKTGGAVESKQGEHPKNPPRRLTVEYHIPEIAFLLDYLKKGIENQDTSLAFFMNGVMNYALLLNHIEGMPVLDDADTGRIIRQFHLDSQVVVPPEPPSPIITQWGEIGGILGLGGLAATAVLNHK